MRLIGEGYTIDYGVTPGGQLFEKHQVGHEIFMRTTNDPERFLRWLIFSEVNDDVERAKNKNRKS